MKIAKIIKNTISITIILSIFIISAFPLYTNAQTTGTTVTTSGSSQATSYLGTTKTTSVSVKDGVTTVSTDLLGCSAGSLLAQVISTGLTSLVGGTVGKTVYSAVPTVPINTNYSYNETTLRQNSESQTSAHTIQQVAGVPFGSSLDAMGWCIVNSIITYIADSTIAWANSGFNGSPAFLENPEQFFTDLADLEAGKFIQELAYNTTGLNVCQPFRVNLGIGLSNNYTSNRFRGSCTLDTISKNFEDFSDGNNFNVGTFWSTWNTASKPQNNPWGAYLLSNDYLYARTSAQNNTATFELGLNQGWMNFKKCEDESNPASCKTYTPGSLIQSNLEKTMGLSKDRLVSVQKFDQVITAVVNNLIKVALNEVLSGSSD